MSQLQTTWFCIRHEEAPQNNAFGNAGLTIVQVVHSYHGTLVPWYTRGTQAALAAHPYRGTSGTSGTPVRNFFST